MRLSGRVRTLERRRGVGAPCPGCGGEGRPCYQVVIEPTPAPEPEGCPVCGKVGTVYQTVFARDDGKEEGRAAACA